MVNLKYLLGGIYENKQENFNFFDVIIKCTDY